MRGAQQTMPRRVRKSHTADEFDLDVLSGDTDMFRWFLLCYLFGKPIQSGVAVTTWRLFVDKNSILRGQLLGPPNISSCTFCIKVAIRATNM